MEYLTGFDNEHETEALPGALPRGRFSPQQVAFGLYAEQFNSTAFTAPRAHNRRSWFYRIRPSVAQGEFQPYSGALLETAPHAGATVTPNVLRWDPLPAPEDATDFVDGWVTIATNGDALAQAGMGIHLYAINRSMDAR